ncbi:MAG: ABC transporter permease subunit [Spirochaetales bacterium]|nr:ABC transporter permease subunit [Spirochaetales bacterium]
MIKSLFIANLKSNWPIILFISVMLLIYVMTAVSMYDPDSIEKMEQMFELLPEGMLKAFGFDNLGSDFTGYLGHYFYGFIIVVFPAIYIVLAANKLVAKHVDTGSMAYLLATPNSRVRIAVTQVSFLLAGLAAIFIVTIGILILMGEAMYPGLLRIGPFLLLNLVTYLVLAVIAALAFFFSCIFNEARYSLALGGGIPVAFLVVKMVSDASEKFEGLRYISLYSVINIDKILAKGAYGAVASLVLLAVATAIYLLSIRIFNKKSLAI